MTACWPEVPPHAWRVLLEETLDDHYADVMRLVNEAAHPSLATVYKIARRESGATAAQLAVARQMQQIKAETGKFPKLPPELERLIRGG